MRMGIVSALSSTPTPDLKVSAHPSMFTKAEIAWVANSVVNSIRDEGVILLESHQPAETRTQHEYRPSPEPLSNAALSTGEDAVAIGLTWLATRHPWIAGSLALIAVAILILMIRWIVRALRALFRSAERRLVGEGEPRARPSPQ